MAIAAYWFKHDSNAKDDYKCMILIDQLGPEGYGIFWILIETLREQTEGRYPMAMLPILAKRYQSSAEKFKAVVTGYGLFETFEDDTFSSSALLRRMEEYNELKRVNSLKGKRSAERRAENTAKTLTVVQPEFNSGSAVVQQKFNEGSRRDVTGVELIRDDVTGRDDNDEYRKLGTHSVSVGVIRSFLKEGYQQSAIDEVLDAVSKYEDLPQVQSVSGLISSWLKKRRENPSKTFKTNRSAPPYKLYTSHDIGGYNMPQWADVDMIRIEGRSACRSAKGTILYARKADVIMHGLTVAQPKLVGQDWPD